MKKVLLTSAAVLAVFASSAAVFANDGNVHTGNLDNTTAATGSDFFTNNEGGLTQAAKDGLNNVDADSTKQNLKMLVNTSNQNVTLTETSSKMNS